MGLGAGNDSDRSPRLAGKPSRRCVRPRTNGTEAGLQESRQCSGATLVPWVLEPPDHKDLEQPPSWDAFSGTRGGRQPGSPRKSAPRAGAASGASRRRGSIVIACSRRRVTNRIGDGGEHPFFRTPLRACTRPDGQRVCNQRTTVHGAGGRAPARATIEGVAMRGPSPTTP